MKEPTNLVCKWDAASNEVVLEVAENNSRRLRDSPISPLKLLSWEHYSQPCSCLGVLSIFFCAAKGCDFRA